LEAIPGSSKPYSPAISPDWSILFKAAGLDSAHFTAAEPDWTHFAYADARAAWKGSLPDRPGLPVHIEAAAWQGQPVYWHMILPSEDTPSTPGMPSTAPTITSANQSIQLGLFLFITAGVVFIARRNLRLGRGDRRGAFRLVFFLFFARNSVSSDHFGSITPGSETAFLW
jgi:hypothetical protein